MWKYRTTKSQNWIDHVDCVIHVHTDILEIIVPEITYITKKINRKGKDRIF